VLLAESSRANANLHFVHPKPPLVGLPRGFRAMLTNSQTAAEMIDIVTIASRVSMGLNKNRERGSAGVAHYGFVSLKATLTVQKGAEAHVAFDDRARI